MPITKTITLYQFAELSDKAKEKARDWLRELEAIDFDPYWEQYETAAKLLGIELDAREIGRTHAGKAIYRSDIRYSGFYSQGDGASFVGRYSFAPDCSKAIRKEFPKDETLHKIADQLTVLATARRLLGLPSITAKIEQSDSHYYHKYTMRLDCEDADGEGVREEDEETLSELMRDFAQWIYDGLQEDYDYRLSDEALDETMEANEYTFTEDGKRED